MYGKTLHTKFEPKNPDKYAGDPTNIICRSSWELYFCTFLDENKEVERWASEEVSVKYWSPMDNKYRNYFIDFLVLFKSGSKVLFEIKPHGQTQPPPVPKKRSVKAEDRYSRELGTFMTNQAKWKAAAIFAKNNGAEFVVFTEHHLRKIGMPV